jgi:hypothetical protein
MAGLIGRGNAVDNRRWAAGIRPGHGFSFIMKIDPEQRM